MGVARATDDLLRYIGGSPTPFHAVEVTASALRAKGFTELAEEAPWSLEPGGRHYVVRNGSSLLAFIAGGGPPAEHGFAVVGAHTDSPNLRLKPSPAYSSHGYVQLGVEVYGGVLLATWTDRDLGLSGRVTVAHDGGVATRLVRVDRAVARVPQLAIHLNREVNEQGLKLDRQLHLAPIVSLGDDAGEFMSWLGGELDPAVDAADVIAFDLMLHTLEPPAVGGISGEFIHAPRLDNLASCHAALEALLSAADHDVAATRMIVLYDNEEIGSETAQGAAGSFLEDVLQRLAATGSGGGEALYRAKARSLILSADMAHAVHPNYADRHDARHMPRLNGGPVIKVNANARYASNAETSAAFERLCREADVPVQKFAMRSDLACGSTIGPIVSTRLGIPAVDVGNPMLSMHSCRETAGSADHELMIRVLTRFFER